MNEPEETAGEEPLDDGSPCDPNARTCHCGKDFSDPMFLTCPGCRIASPNRHRQGGRTGAPCWRKPKPNRMRESGDSFDNVVKAYEDVE